MFAYSCEPGKGSEPGVGWMWARMLARIADSVVVITRANNAGSIEAELPSTPERERLEFEYVDLPAWARFWKRGPRGARLYYLLWQVAALRRAREIRKRRQFGIVWHLTLANLWLGSLAPLATPEGAAFVYGPVGGGVTPPRRLLMHLGPRGFLYEVARGLARLVGRYLNPLSRLAWKRSSLLLAQNPETLAWLPKKYQMKYRIFAHGIIEDLPAGSEESRTPRTALFAGRVVTWKGLGLALRAVALTEGWRMTVCGEGPDERRLKKLVSELNLTERVRFLGSVPRDEVKHLMRISDVFLYPSLHDDSPLAIVEAMACGLPVICLDRGGPPVLIGPAGGRAVPAEGSPQRISRSLAECLANGMPDRADVIERARTLTVPIRAEELRNLLVREGLL